MEVLDDYPARFEGYWLAGMRKKLGIQTEEAGDKELVGSLLDWMHRSGADFTNTFRDLSSEEPPALFPEPIVELVVPNDPANPLEPSQ